MASETSVHRLMLPNNPADAWAALRKFAASLEETANEEASEGDDE